MRWTWLFEQIVMCGPETSTTSTNSDGAGTAARQSITPSSRLKTAVSGTGGGSAMALRASSSSMSHKSDAASASGASGVVTGICMGLTRVTMRATRSGDDFATSRAMVPPRLTPTRLTFLPAASAVSRSWRSTSPITRFMGPTLRPQVQGWAMKSCRARNSRRREVVISGDRKPGITITGWPLPTHASSGKGGGASNTCATAAISRASVVAETGASRDGQLAKRPARVMALFHIAPTHGQRAKAQRIELDEAGRILLVIGALVVLEGHQALAVE